VRVTPRIENRARSSKPRYTRAHSKPQNDTRHRFAATANQIATQRLAKARQTGQCGPKLTPRRNPKIEPKLKHTLKPERKLQPEPAPKLRPTYEHTFLSSVKPELKPNLTHLLMPEFKPIPNLGNE
jgi:hypothetical protein